MTKPVDHEAEIAIRQLEVTALNFAYQATNIASIRSEYARRTQELTANLRAAYQNGEMSAKAAAQTANEMRNRRCGCPIPGQGVRRRRTGLGGVATKHCLSGNADPPAR